MHGFEVKSYMNFTNKTVSVKLSLDVSCNQDKKDQYTLIEQTNTSNKSTVSIVTGPGKAACHYATRY